jgi:peptide/nickel transport system permease protein
MIRLTGSPIDMMLPEDATEEDYQRISKLWGLDKPWPTQYAVFLKNSLRLEFGDSIAWKGQTALELIISHFPATLQLAALAMVISILLAVPIGVVSAVKKGSWFDKFGKLIALLGQSLPNFWLAIVLMWIFAVHLGWVPTSGNYERKSIILPAVAMGWFSVAAFMRLTRSSMLNVLDTEYIKLAKIKGLPSWKVIWKHGLRNAAIPPLTFFGIVFGHLIAGSVTTETVFAWPGIGQLLLEAVNARDYPVVQALALLGCAIYIMVNLIIDILYSYIDPRVRY